MSRILARSVAADFGIRFLEVMLLLLLLPVICLAALRPGVTIYPPPEGKRQAKQRKAKAA